MIIAIIVSALYLFILRTFLSLILIPIDHNPYDHYYYYPTTNTASAPYCYPPTTTTDLQDAHPRDRPVHHGEASGRAQEEGKGAGPAADLGAQTDERVEYPPGEHGKWK